MFRYTAKSGTLSCPSLIRLDKSENTFRSKTRQSRNVKNGLSSSSSLKEEAIMHLCRIYFTKKEIYIEDYHFEATQLNLPVTTITIFRSTNGSRSRNSVKGFLNKL